MRSGTKSRAHRTRGPGRRRIPTPVPDSLTARSHHPGDSGAAAALRVHDLRKNSGEVQPGGGGSVEVAPGDIVGLLGPNGAGKTTIISPVLAVLAPSSGSIRIGN